MSVAHNGTRLQKQLANVQILLILKSTTGHARSEAGAVPFLPVTSWSCC